MRYFLNYTDLHCISHSRERRHFSLSLLDHPQKRWCSRTRIWITDWGKVGYFTTCPVNKSVFLYPFWKGVSLFLIWVFSQKHQFTRNFLTNPPRRHGSSRFPRCNPASNIWWNPTSDHRKAYVIEVMPSGAHNKFITIVLASLMVQSDVAEMESLRIRERVVQELAKHVKSI